MDSYKKPGTYVAVCGTTAPHYIRVFEFPQKDDQSFGVDANGVYRKADDPKDQIYVDASWYYLNRIDFFAFMYECFPIEMFEPLKEHFGPVAQRQTQGT